MKGDPWVMFRVHVNRRGSGKRGPFYRVFIFDHVRTMRAFLTEQDRKNPALRARGTGWDRTMAAARYFGPHTITRSPNQCGVVVFCAEFMGGGVVAHELVHAALYATRPGKSFPFKFPKWYDETLAWTVGDMVAQFWRACWRRERSIKALRRRN